MISLNPCIEIILGVAVDFTRFSGVQPVCGGGGETGDCLGRIDTCIPETRGPKISPFFGAL